MIVVCECTEAHKSEKPVICPKCDRGRISKISEQSETTISRRGKPPPDECCDYVQVKCPVCGTLWSLTIEN